MKVPEFIKKAPTGELKIDKNTVEHIIDGTIVVNSVELMLKVMKKFPAEPNLVRIYADLLQKHKMYEAAVKAYNRATKQFLDGGRILPAIVAKISQWHIEMPSDQHVQSFLSDLTSDNNKTLPLGHFFSKLFVKILIFC